MSESAEASGRSGGGLRWFTDLLRTWGPPILAVLVIRAFIFEPFRIPSGSMVPTLLVGDFVLVTKFSYGLWLPWVRTEILDLGDPERGDIVVFRYPQNERLNYIKRVVAIPGDRISVRNNQILINGERQPWVPAEDAYSFIDDRCNVTITQRHQETLGEVTHDVLVNRGVFGGPLRDKPEVEVPPGHVFVMGDNRDNSEDSRSWGFVRFDQIKGKARAVLVSIDTCQKLPRMERTFQGLY